MRESKQTAANAVLGSVRDFWEQHVNNEYYTKHERFTDEYFSEIERRRYRFHYHLRDLFRELEGSEGRLLEIGCGPGVDSIQLARCGFDVTAIDLTENAIEVARQFARKRGLEIDFRVGNAENLAFESESFDYVYSFGVLHHTPDTERAVNEVHRVLKPGGVAFIMLYHTRSFVNLVHRLFRLPYESPKNLKDECPVVYTFTRTEAARLFEQFSRIEIKSEYPFTYGLRFLTGWMPTPALRLLGQWFGWHLMIRATR